MKMKSTNVNLSYNKAMSLLAFCLCLVLAFALFLPSTTTYADYSDLNENSIVNFNQLIAFNSIYGGGKNNDYAIYWSSQEDNVVATLKYDIEILANHKYYWCVKDNENNYYNMFNLGGNSNIRPNQISTIEGTATYNDIRRFNWYNEIPLNTTLYFIFVDLTTMFGSSFEPNLEQCKDLFTANYYNYTTGTSIPLNKSYLQGYQDGANAVYDALTITFNAYTIGSNSQTYGNNTIERGTLYFDNIYSAYTFTGVISINMLSNITRGTNINVNFKLWIPDLQGENSNYARSFKLYFGYLNDNNELIQIVEIEPIPLTGVQENTYQGNFVLPIDTQTIYCWVDYNTIGDNFSPTSIIAYQTEMSFKSVDIGLLINNAYNNGASATTLEYQPGGIRYDSIYQLGKANGLAEGNTFGNGLEIIGTTFTQVFSFFNIEILPGIPLTIFILLPLLVGLIIFIVKMTKGD